MLTDDDLLEFHPSSLLMTEAGDARRLLHEHGEVYRAQLIAACWLEDSQKRRAAESDAVPWPRRTSSDHEAGFEEAVRTIIARLRQGDFLPGGDSYRDIQGY
jgi:hypothetical protein